MCRDSIARHTIKDRTRTRKGPIITVMLVGCMLLAAVVPAAALAGPAEDAKAAQNRGDHTTAAIISRALSHSDDGDALYRLGLLYRQGQGVKKNYDEALKWFGRAAALGSAQAQYSLADMYLRGLGVGQDLTVSAKWYKRAAEQGHMQAQFLLGLLYKLGGGVRQNLGAAARWLGRAAAQGHTEAQYELGLLYSSGRGVRKDYVAAYQWQLLARNDSRNARVRASAQEALEKLNSAMTASQIAEARQKANAWQAIPEGSTMP